MQNQILKGLLDEISYFSTGCITGEDEDKFRSRLKEDIGTVKAFIGYSLPEADYHFRTLLRRAIRKNTVVEVYLHHSDEPPEKSERDSYPSYLKNNITFATERYESLFGKNHINFNFDGVNAYIENCFSTEDFPQSLQDLREMLM